MAFDWSGVVPIYERDGDEIAVIVAEIDTLHMKTETKAPRGRPLQQWDYLFSPTKFDKEIGIQQFSGRGLPLEEMQTQGVMASLIRQVLIERA